MKKSQFIFLVSLICFLVVSCKKQSTSPIAGTWTEQAPCVVYGCYTFVFSNDYHYTESVQGTTDTNTYSLLSGNRIVFNTQYFGIDTYNYQLIGSTELILDSFYDVPSGGTGAGQKYNVTLIKNN